jgi:cellulose synthase/poly-beta-1,6-N-acetylglucosamine synthase-like glycosyltransferase
LEIKADMGDIIMDISAFLFAILFFFLLFGFITTMISLYRKKTYPDYEPDVSIVIPAYNEEKNIAECLNSIFNLDYPSRKMEVIVVDDGSTDSTPKILRSYCLKYKNLKAINGKHEGKSESLNLGIKCAKHDLVMTLDADTVVRRDSLKALIKPFSKPEIGATNGTCFVKNSNSLLGMFQRIEYHYNNLLRKGFSTIFDNGIWFFGAFACYRKSLLEQMGYFKKDTMAEDFDTALEMYSLGFNTINVETAIGKTVVPSTFRDLINQRVRWWLGVIQALYKHRHLFRRDANKSILFLFVNHLWWSFYSLISLPLIGYQIAYWLPYNLQNGYTIFMYLFRWFSLLGPAYVIYMIPEWGVSLYSIFGVLSGILSTSLIIYAIYFFNDKLRFKNLFGIFFYFPYTIILNTIIFISLARYVSLKKRYFID